MQPNFFLKAIGLLCIVISSSVGYSYCLALTKFLSFMVRFVSNLMSLFTYACISAHDHTGIPLKCNGLEQDCPAMQIINDQHSSTYLRCAQLPAL